MRTSLQALSSSRRYLNGLLCLALSAATLYAEEATDASEATHSNYIVLGTTHADLNGSETAWRARQNYTKGLRGGFNAVHIEEALSNDWWFKMDGRAIFDENEYLFQADFEKAGVNRTRIGFENYRYWFDARTTAIAGSPLLKPFDPSLHLDRSKFYVESIFFPSDVLDLTFRYTYHARDGKKASSSWGDSNYNSRKAVPSFREIDEERHRVEIEAARRWDGTTAEAAVRWDHTDINNSLNFIRDYDNPDEERYYTQIDENESDHLSARGILQHRASEMLTLNASAMYSRLDGDLGGSRIIGDSFFGSYVSGIQNYANPQRRDHGFINLDGDYDLDQYVVTFSALYQPTDDWFITPSIRLETTNNDVSATETETEIGVESVIADEVDLASKSSVDYDSIAAEIGVRYSGITNWTFYADAYAAYGEGDHLELQYDITDPLDPEVDRDTDYERTDTKLTLGANWYAHPTVTIGIQGYYKTGDNDYDHRRSITDDDYSAYIIEQNRDTIDFNVRVNWRVLPNLTSISRFDYQESTIDTQMFGKSSIETADRERFSYSQSLNYQANERLSFFASLNYVNDELTGPASDFFSSQDTAEVAESNMDYFYGQLTGMYIYSDSLEFSASIGSLLSDNDYDNSAESVPYGNHIAEYHLTAGLTKKLHHNKRITIEYGYYDYEDDTLNGDADFEAHVLTAKYEYRF